MKKYMRICPRCGNTYESDQQTPICKACTEEINKMKEQCQKKIEMIINQQKQQTT